SYRSHAEGFIVRGPDPVGRRASCEAKYRSYAPALRERLAACLNGDAVPFTAEWISVLRRYRSAAEPLIGTGELSFAAAESGAAGASWDPEMLRHSRFHQMLQGPGGRMAALQSDPGFLAFRFALNYLYLHLNRIGIRPVERFVLCHLVARTVEEHFGITAEDFAAAGTAG
ncbi:MAG TPA: lantibiotic dehydratase C-terminal domain-containing protein, partial [Actinoplanes sp.]|nr:lantibiotic dehydratase C-terminal domain-containing protein [Actinoplanes sp.]